MPEAGPPGLGFGGALNERGWKVSSNQGTWSKDYNYGGNAGGPGIYTSNEDAVSPSGYGGGRIVPGTRVNSPPRGSSATTSYGGAGGEAGGNGNSVGGYTGSSGGGGGWGRVSTLALAQRRKPAGAIKAPVAPVVIYLRVLLFFLRGIVNDSFFCIFSSGP